jgi:hypothetical protein
MLGRRLVPSKRKLCLESHDAHFVQERCKLLNRDSIGEERHQIRHAGADEEKAPLHK